MNETTKQTITINGKDINVTLGPKVDIESNILKWSRIDSLVKPSTSKKGNIMFPPIHFIYLVDKEIKRLKRLKYASKYEDEKQALQSEITYLIKEYHRNVMIVNRVKKEIKAYGFKVNTQ